MAAHAPQRPDFVAVLKDAGIAAVIAFALALPLIGFRTVDDPAGLGIETRFDWVAIGVGAVFIGRILLSYWGVLRRSRPGLGAALAARAGALAGPYVGWMMLGAIGFAFVLPFLPFSSRYLIDVATTVLTYMSCSAGA